jgi:hypothetical protein
MILFLLLKRERRLLSHLCQICLALLKIQQFWKYHAISGGKYPNAHRKHDFIFIIRKRKKAFVPFMSDLTCLTKSTAVLKISRYFRRQISYCFQKTWSYFYYYKKSFVPFMSDLSCFTESTAVLKISRYFRRQISYCFQKTWSYFYYLKEKEGFCPIYVRFVLLYWKHSSFENISLFQEANILLLTVNMTLYL